MKIKKNEIFKILKFIFSSGSSFLLDLLLFYIFNKILKNILLSTILSRVLSSLYNYFFNSRFVFKQYTKSSILKYYSLVVIQLFVSAFSVNIISNILLNIEPTIIKFFIDIIIFIVNYFVQKEVVFK